MLGHEIQRVRESKGMTREQLVARMDSPCSETVLRQYENGKLDMNVEVFFDLTKALGVTPNDLAPRNVMENAVSGLGDYARLNGANKDAADQMIGVFLRHQRGEEAG